MNKQARLLYFEGCPNVEAARENLRTALGHARLPKNWEETDLKSSDCPERWRGFPSPTVLIDGADVVSGAQEQSGAAACRANGAPGRDEIEKALRTVGDRSWLATLATVPGVVMGMFPTLICPACFPAVAGFLGSIGLGALNDDKMIAPVTTGCLTLAIAGLTYQAWRKRRIGPLLLGIAGAGGIYAGIFLVFSTPLKNTGIAALVAASLWNVVSKRRAGVEPCPACV